MNAEEQAVWDFNMECWELWNDGGASAQAYLDDCWNVDIRSWWAEYALPFGEHWVADGGLDWLTQNDIVAFDAQPHTIDVKGDVAGSRGS